MDSQGNTTSTFNQGTTIQDNTIFEVLTDNVSAKDAVQKTRFKNLDIISSSPKMRAIDTRFAGDLDAQYILKENIDRGEWKEGSQLPTNLN